MDTPSEELSRLFYKYKERQGKRNTKDFMIEGKSEGQRITWFLTCLLPPIQGYLVFSFHGLISFSLPLVTSMFIFACLLSIPLQIGSILFHINGDLKWLFVLIFFNHLFILDWIIFKVILKYARDISKKNYHHVFSEFKMCIV